MWICPNCREEVPPIHVSYDQDHDVEGCHEHVQWFDTLEEAVDVYGEIKY